MAVMRLWKLRSTGRAAFAATLTIGAVLACGAGPAMAAEACRVQFTDIQLQPYVSGGRTMHRVLLTGEHNYSAASNTGGADRTRFEIVDNDGFIVMAAFAARWRNGGEGAVDVHARNVRVPRAELETLKRAVQIGQAYYIRGLERAAENPPANLPALRESVGRKQRLLDELLIVLDEASDHRAADDTVVLGSLTWFNAQMARFRIGAPESLQSQYRDVAIEGAPANRLCDAAARSAFIGRLACPAALPGSPAPAVPAPCPDGLTFSPVLFPPSQS